MQPLSRRQFLYSTGAAAALALAPRLTQAADEPKKFELPKLPYDYDALEPHIDAETMKIHHDFHHKAYVDNLNKALVGHEDLAKKRIGEILRDAKNLPKDIQLAVINNGGGHYNHSMFWRIMSKDGGQPGSQLGKAIDEAFGSFDKFQAQLTDGAMKRFGSGWSWLVLDQGKLKVLSTKNQDCPLMDGQTPIMGIDVWEHAYYLKYRNKRADYVKAWWNVVNWKAVDQRYERAMRQS